jgi:hypothetical protein
LRVQLRVLAATGTAIAILSASAQAQISGVIARELAGESLTQFPFADYVRVFHEGTSVRCMIDPGTNPGLVGQTVDLYVVDSKNIIEWRGNPSLVDVSGGAETVVISGADIQSNTFVVDSGTLSGNAGIELGVPYDLVIDVNQNGTLDAGDYIDGYSNNEAGFYICSDPTLPGPLSTVELTYDLSAGTWDEQNTFYPTNISTMGELPLVVISHGNGHNYQWYDHLGTHLASHGYVVMSHSNATGAGVLSASGTTLSNVDDFLGNLGTIGGGVLQGHVDVDRMSWIGHSRGGEGVVIAYHRVFSGAYNPIHWQIDDVQLVSSIAPVDFLTYPQTDPHAVNYHLWTGGSDADVNGCANCNLCQTFHLHDRAQAYRQSISLHGVGHGDFHNGGGSSVATGPCLVGRPNTHLIMKGYLFPLLERYVDGNVPAVDYLTRQWESFRPPGAPTSLCVNVDLMYREGAAPGKLVLDDFQSNPSTGVASSGLGVLATVTGLVEGHMDDPNSTFTNSAEFFNGFTVNGDGADDSAGAVFEWDGNDAYYAYIVPGGGPLNLWKEISFRACQSTRDNLTTPVLGDLTFNVTVVDTAGNFSRINISAFGGGIEEPYQRTSCGIGAGWANEFETIRVPIEAFQYNNTAINLSSILGVAFEFGPSHGSNEGRIGIDDVELYFN